MKLRKSSEFYNDPTRRMSSDPPDLPVNTVVDNLMSSEGPRLELMSRTTPAIIKATTIVHIYATILGSQYVQTRYERILRVNTSNGGGGRRDLIDALEAGGTVPDAYYTVPEKGPTEYSYIRSEGDQ